jgi:ABC-2 type transport system permease protein
MGNVVRIALKDLRLLWRDKFGMFWVLAFPLIMGLFFGSVFGGGGGNTAAMKIAIVDLDDSKASKDFAAALESTDAIDLWKPTDDTGAPVPVTEDSARDGVRQGRVTAFVVIPKGYDTGGVFGGFGTELRVGIDPSRKAEAGYLQGLIMEASFKRMQTMFADRDTMKSEIDRVSAEVNDWDVSPAQKLVFKGFFGSLKAFMNDVDQDVYEKGPGGGDAGEGGTGEPFSPVKLDIEEVAREGVGPRTAFEISFPQAMMWAVIGTAAGFAVTFVRERKEGTLLRLRIAPHPLSVILAGKALGCFVACAGSLVLLTAVAHFILGMRIESPGLYALGVVCTSLCFVGVMMAISVIGKTEEAVGGAGWGVLLIMAMLGGAMIPLMIMPKWMADLSTVSPVRWGVWSLEGAVWRGLTLTQMLPAYAILLGVGVVAFAIGVVVLRRREF